LLTENVRMPVSSTCASTLMVLEIRKVTMVPPSRSRTSSSVTVPVGWVRVAPESFSSSQVITDWSSVETMTTRAETPSISFGSRRIEEIAPSRISPTPSGRRGMTPGFGGCAHPGGAADHPGAWPHPGAAGA
jgi:hypothetical protein